MQNARRQNKINERAKREEVTSLSVTLKLTWYYVASVDTFQLKFPVWNLHRPLTTENELLTQ